MAATPSAPASAVRTRLVALLDPVVRGAGYDLESLTVTPAGRRRLVRVVVDGDGGVSLDDVADVTRAISGALDEADSSSALLGGAPYVLEVTSPGVDRPLREARHWRRATGRLVRVSRTEAGSVCGRVLGADEDGVILDVDGIASRFRYADIGPGAVQVEFSRPPDQLVGSIEAGEPA